MLSRPILQSLNDKQKKAVTAPRRPELVLAGPGTGKTRTLIARIIYCIDRYGISPEQILALTFSNKAAREMRERLREALGKKAERVFTGTIHGFCLQVLRSHYRQAGLSPHFSVADEDYRERLLRVLVEQRSSSEVDKKLRGIKTAFEHFQLKEKPLKPFSQIIYDSYSEHLKKHKLVDFNQILLLTRDLLRDNPEIRDHYDHIYQAILVDEFQDTDRVQYDIIRMLAEQHRHIFVVADDDQSIYAWRGANPENIRQYMEDFKIEEAIFLDTNYRSGKNIVSTAQQVVSGLERIEPDKVLQADNELADSIQSFFFDYEDEEISFIVEKIRDWEKQGVPYGEIAVLYPRHRFAEKIVNRFIHEHIPFQQAARFNLTDDPRMKRVLAYLQVIRNPLDNLHLEELVQLELDYNSHKQIQNLQKRNGLTYRQALYGYSARPELSSDERHKTDTFIGHLANLINLRSFYRFDQLVAEILSGLAEMDRTYYESRAPRFKSFPVSTRNVAGFNYLVIFHSREEIARIGAAMLETQYPDKTDFVTTAKRELEPGTLLLALEEFPEKPPAGCTLLNLLEQTEDQRQSEMSALFRWLQNSSYRGNALLRDYVVLDLETTGADTATCGIVELAAVKVRDGEITDSFTQLINPQMPIEEGAERVHHISTDDVAEAPVIKKVWPGFLKFIGNDMLVAHNGYAFDFKILDRVARELSDQKLLNNRFDSLMMARRIYPGESHSIDALAARFKLDPGTRHRALDDVIVLHDIIQKMRRAQDSQLRKTAVLQGLEFVALANFLLNKTDAFEDKVMFLAGARKLISPFSKALNVHTSAYAAEKEKLIEALTRKAHQLDPELVLHDSADEFRQRVMDIAAQFAEVPVDKAIAEFLSSLALINPQDALNSVDAVSLLTFHSAKGLEFQKVIILGMEDENMPSFWAYKEEDDDDDRPVSKKLEEQKRLLYVGLTRAKDEVLFSAVRTRFNRDNRSSPFLREILKFIRTNA